MSDVQNKETQWLAEDLARVEAMAKELEAYIVVGEVYHTLVAPAPQGNRKITMSGGDLLARLNRLRTQQRQLTPEQQSRFTQVDGSVQQTIYSLRTRFHELLRRELKARKDQLAWNMDVRRSRSEEKADPAEVQNREHIAAIQAELNRPL
ncbi:MAG: hypothetical protein R3C14_41770 [Caldilineaceae bacterium]